MPGPTSPLLRLVSAVALPALLSLLPVLGAVPASAQPETGTGTREERVTPAEHYAALLAEQPEGAAVVVDDALAGRYVPEELKADLHESFGALDVPYHVVASPFPGAEPQWGGDVLPALADRVGADGLYVLLQPDSVPRAVAEGVDLPVEAAADAVFYAPGTDYYGAPLDEVADAFAAALADPDAQATADRLRQEYSSEQEAYRSPTVWEEFLEDLDPTTSVGPDNLGFLVSTVTGALLTLSLFHVWWTRRRGGSTVIAVAVASVFGLALPAAGVAGSLYYLDSVPLGANELPDPLERVRTQPPYVPSTVRVERVVQGLADGSVYADPLSPLSREGLADVAERAERSSVPVYAVLLPMADTDESEGDPERFAHAMHHVLGEDGVYAVITHEPYQETPETTVLAFGADLDTYYLDRALDEGEATTPAQELALLLEAVEELPRDPEAADPVPYDTSTDPLEPRTVRFWEDFWAGVLFLGPVVGATLLGAVLGTVALIRVALVRGRHQPSPRALRRTAERERARLAALLSSGRAGRLPASMMPPVEAALMVMDADPDDLDLVGVAVVSRRAHAALEDPGSAETSPCMVNPLHGPAEAFKRAGPPRRRGLFPVCRPCADLTDRQRTAALLQVRDGAGTRRDHLSMNERAWVQYRFGAKNPARMAERLLEEIDAR
ncbi:hypothetical protein KGD83_11290 [Nocardiopsis akebiae]|uniref:DUF4350 domain-containing protein n=1 Tax=Nocardiopsis akebiae TaxID=2831968 RepID=A0ABX8CBT1_9ACTN|nr:hypothetical protein [Nocardiopsis akebiae]QUX31019.1 hypothetical protein KGD83_11290 [Nocardiopsis akebiae]